MASSLTTYNLNPWAATLVDQDAATPPNLVVPTRLWVTNASGVFVPVSLAAPLAAQLSDGAAAVGTQTNPLRTLSTAPTDPNGYPVVRPSNNTVAVLQGTFTVPSGNSSSGPFTIDFGSIGLSNSYPTDASTAILVVTVNTNLSGPVIANDGNFQLIFYETVAGLTQTISYGYYNGGILGSANQNSGRVYTWPLTQGILQNVKFQWDFTSAPTSGTLTAMLILCSTALGATLIGPDSGSGQPTQIRSAPSMGAIREGQGIVAAASLEISRRGDLVPWSTLGNGDNYAGPSVPEDPTHGRHTVAITSATTTTLESGIGGHVICSITNCAATTTGLITVYDSSGAASGTVVWAGTILAGDTKDLGRDCLNGITIVTTNDSTGNPPILFCDWAA